MKINRIVVVVAAVIPWFCSHSWGIVDPTFTPADLVASSQLIASATVGGDVDTLSLTDIQLLKGTKLATELTLKGEAGVALAGHVGETAVLLRGRADAYLFAGDNWYDVKVVGQVVHLNAINSKMKGTFNGGADMLAEMCKHFIKHPKHSIPTTVGTEWYDFIKLESLPQTPNELHAVVLAPGGKVHIHVASSSGDRLFVHDRRKVYSDVTADVKITAASHAALWMDVNGDGSDDLLSWTGSGIDVHLVRDGVVTREASLCVEVAGECEGLKPVYVHGAQAAVLICRSEPVVLALDGTSWRTIALEGVKSGKGLLVFDFDNDGFSDILQTHADESLLWRGGKDGFAAPEKIAMGDSGDVVSLLAGDFNEDGLTDIFVAGSMNSQIWENDGKGAFRHVISRSGSTGYKPATGVRIAFVADLNHDSRPDIGLIFGQRELQYHFNRGFRTFAEEGELTIADLPVEAGRPEHVLIEDINGDGSQDLVVACSSGEIYILLNGIYDVPTLRLTNPVGGAALREVRVREVHEGVPGSHYGTFTVSGTSTGTLVPIRTSGVVQLDWMQPTGERVEINVKVDNRVKRVVLDKTSGDL